MKATNQTRGLNSYKNLSDKVLEETLLVSVSKENQLKIEILHLLAEVEKRRLYSKNHPSLFEYCTKVLKYSASSAQRRIDTMRAMKLIPEIEQKLVTGELNLSSVAQAQSFFRHEAKVGKTYSIDSKKEVLKKLENKTTKECLKELITISPESIPQEKRREITPEKTELKVVLNKELVSNLDKIKALLSHKNPTMTDQELIEFMVKLTLNRIDPAERAKRIQKRTEAARSKNQATLQSKAESLGDDAQSLPMIGSEVCVKQKGVLETSPEEPSPEGSGLKNQQPRMGASIQPRVSVNPRYVPGTVKTEVYMRDKGQCTHPNCRSRKFLEYDHIKPVALGGKSTIDNVRLLCRTHNQYTAIQRFGYKKMRQYFRS